MATYAELAALPADAGFGGLQSKVRVAVVIKAVALLELVAPTSAQVAWAQQALSNPAAASDSVLWYVIAANDSATPTQIINATDSAVQTNVDAAVDKIVSA